MTQENYISDVVVAKDMHNRRVLRPPFDQHALRIVLKGNTEAYLLSGDDSDWSGIDGIDTICHRCQKDDFEIEHELPHHLLTHSNDEPWNCGNRECRQDFATTREFPRLPEYGNSFYQ